MSEVWTTIEGRSYVTVEGAAACFEVERLWVLEVCEAGLVPSPIEREGQSLLAADALDELARVLGLHRHLGLPLSELEIWLEVWARR